MDRRQRKTREAIFAAFSRLLGRRRYEHITVQDIIDEADIGRSTFYAHFETKDTLLKALCSDIFEHILVGEGCDYPADSDTLLAKLTHILWHLQPKQADIRGILASRSGEVFMGHLREYLDALFEQYLTDFHAAVPSTYLKNHLVGAFCETVRWWVGQCPEMSPDEVARCYMAVIETH